MRMFDAIIIGITVGVARLLRGVLGVYDRLINPLRDKPLSPFGKCDKVARLRNNRSSTRMRDLRATLPTATEETPHRQLMQ
jgi:hypothetical protein